MSRHIKQITPNKYIAYGIDHALGYWFDVIDESLEEDIQIIDSESTVLTGISNADIARLLKIYGIDAAVISKIYMDLPI